MRKIQRLAAVGSMAALTVALAACGGGSEAPAAEAPAPASAPMESPMTSAPMAAGDGVTEISDIFGPACSQVPTEGEGSAEGMVDDPVATAASNNPLLTTLVTAVGQVPGLAETLNSQEAITVFAPANPAFEAVQQQLGEEQFNALLANTEMLQTILSYHVVPQRMDAEGLVEAGTVTQLAGGDVTIGGTPEAPTVTDAMGNTANVLCGNIPTANATVFVIDKVLMPQG
ncbi:fasciclin domain-containing protein [Pseudonocardia sichuanensis]|uniref:Putative surface protein with fasciclin (FAS1) repeats n=1 Tax=Pseudonocardia kunmingensis TaxID=630975 RepID=A0A543E1Y6_9PSEU|nr:fasciclin domain-containing protein [Pseudonocardia kunmingensis]TQM15593.1 putative surface protein with fasciclin (FAS1) repeats [Pseudonocardia kunmingensis]